MRWLPIGKCGLSPRVRGNLERRLVFGVVLRSIPAGAGEPRQRSCGRLLTRVYPRGCGGTGSYLAYPRRQRGLSPRVRGNPPPPGPLSLRPRSIPAGAGEPMTPRSPGAVSAVYPRGCGGTHCSLWASRPAGGLSPRVRGNHVVSSFLPARAGSIPAGAGEPAQD